MARNAHDSPCVTDHAALLEAAQPKVLKWAPEPNGKPQLREAVRNCIVMGKEKDRILMVGWAPACSTRPKLGPD